MKKSIISVVALVLSLSFLLISCGDVVNNDSVTTDGVTESNTEVVESIEGVDTTGAATTEEATTEAVVVPPVDTKETLIDSETSEEVYKLFTSGKGLVRAPVATEAPYVINNVTLMNNCKLTSMTIPVQKTTNVDADGNFTLTLMVYDSSFSGLKKEAKRSYQIKINAAQYDIKANNSKVKKVIDVDLSSYDITLGENEAIGFFSKDDTLFPAILKCSAATLDPLLKVIRQNDIEITGFYSRAGTKDIAFSHDTLLINFEWENLGDGKVDVIDADAYAAMIAELKTKYSGKYLSVIGDSISSYDGMCNDTKANSTIGKNEPYYPNFSGNVYDSSLMYWGKVMADLDMKPCVMNTWSGSLAVGKADGTNMLERAAQLHRDGGTPNNPSDDIKPDVIIVYIGINDLNGSAPLDSAFATALTKSPTTAMKNWFPGVLAAQKASGSTKRNEAFSNFDQVYALSINKMRELYPDAEIYCLTYQENNHANTTAAKLNRFSSSVTAIAEYFGATVVDQSKDAITQSNCHVYAHDKNSLHPTSAGHAIMAENIIKTMYEKAKN